jgi:hypothetical protein
MQKTIVVHDPEVATPMPAEPAPSMTIC